MIAGDHDHADAGLLAVADRVRHIGAGRIFEADQAEEGQILIGGAQSGAVASFAAQASTRRP